MFSRSSVVFRTALRAAVRAAKRVVLVGAGAACGLMDLVLALVVAVVFFFLGEVLFAVDFWTPCFVAAGVFETVVRLAFLRGAMSVELEV